MSEEKTVYPCVQLSEGELCDRVLTCGDPARAKKIADLLEDSVCLKQNREFHTYSGKWKGVPVSVISHGVGAGGAAIAFESMMKIGIKAIIRVGTCGGMQKGIDAGSIIISTGACRDDGVSEKMVPLGYPALCDIDIIKALDDAAEKRGIPYHQGITMTNALLYGSLMGSNVKLYAKANVKAMENEIAPLLILASLYNVKAGAILTADAPAFELIDASEYKPDESVVKKSIEDQILIALDALASLDL
ncbi:MAG: nucleoside phosphorylase [Erysipelotrichaceae bacterium]|nr:nucleoside phosphorylase [Erysipelotrichaceae bacterium]